MWAPVSLEAACDHTFRCLFFPHRVEKVLKDSGCALIWISHDPEQPLRVGGKILELPGGTLSALNPVIGEGEGVAAVLDAAQEGAVSSVAVAVSG